MRVLIKELAIRRVQHRSETNSNESQHLVEETEIARPRRQSSFVLQQELSFHTPSPSLQAGGGTCEHSTAPFARPGVCARAPYLYVWPSHMVITCSRLRINQEGCQSCSWSAEQEKRIFPCSHTRLRISSHETGSAVPSRVGLLILHTQAESGAHSRDSSRFPPYTIGSVPKLSSRAIAYR